MHTQATFTREWSGPLPSPDVLREFDAVVPGAGERILAMAERQARHRQSIESEIVSGNIAAERIGQYFGFVVSLAFGGASVWLMQAGMELGGTVFGVGTLVGLVTVFINGRQMRERDLASRARASPKSEVNPRP